ncbi:MAG: diguanylate cyclase, partial [Wolbachia pipientis]
VMPDTNVSDAYTIAERIRKIIAKEPFVLADKNTTHNVTVSIGIAEMQGSDFDDIKKFIVRADRYLYKAKNSGRNRVVTGYS